MNFRYLGKEKLDGSDVPFLFFLHELLNSLPLGKEYYTQLKNLKDAADAAATAALAKIRQLSPIEFSIFAGKHLGDGSGRRAARHVLELFLGLLDSAVKDSEPLEASFRAFASMLKTSPMANAVRVPPRVWPVAWEPSSRVTLDAVDGARDPWDCSLHRYRRCIRYCRRCAPGNCRRRAR